MVVANEADHCYRQYVFLVVAAFTIFSCLGVGVYLGADFMGGYFTKL